MLLTKLYVSRNVRTTYDSNTECKHTLSNYLSPPSSEFVPVPTSRKKKRNIHVGNRICVSFVLLLVP